MSGTGQGGPARAAPGLEAPHHRSWDSDDFQKLLATHFGGNDDNLPPSEVSPLLRLTTDGAMLTELLQTLEGGDAGGAAAGAHALFSEDTINRILGEQMAEAAAAAGVAAQAPALPPMQQQGSADLQTAGSGQSATTVPGLATKMSLQEATVAMQVAHATSPIQLQPTQHAQQAAPITATIPQLMAVPTAAPQLTPVAVPSPTGAGMHGAPHALPPPPLPAPHAQQYVAVVDGRVLQQPDGTAVLASLPTAAPAAMAIPGSNQVLQYIPVLGSQVITIPQAAAAPQTFTPPFSGSPADGPAPVLAAVAAPRPGMGAATPPTTTPTSAAAATAAIYTSEISATQQLVAAAAVQQELLRQEVAALAGHQQALSGGDSGPVPMVTTSSGATPTLSGGGGGGGSATPVNLAMPPPPPRPARRSAEFAALQAPTLTPQLRPAAAGTSADASALVSAQTHAAVTPLPAPVPTLRPVVTAAPTTAAALELTPAPATTPPSDTAAMPPPPPRAPSAMDLMRELMQADERASAEAKARQAASAAAAADAAAPSTDLPRRPSHKRERSLRSASPLLADPSTAPVAKVAKGNSEEEGGSACSDGSDAVADAILGASTLGSSPDSCLLGAAVAGSAAPSSGGGSPLGVGHSEGPGVLPPPPVQMPGGDISKETIAAMAAALAPKPGAKRRGRPPKLTPAAASAAAGGAGAGADGAAEPSDAEILEALLREDPSRQSLRLEDIKKLVRKEKNRVAAAASRSRAQTHTAALEGQVAALQAEQAHLAGWLHAPPQGPPHRVLLSGPAAAAAAAAVAAGKPPVRHLSL